MIETLIKKGMEFFGRYYSTYRGIVLDNEDPNEQGRLLITVPSISTTSMWAYPITGEGSLNSGIKWITPIKGQVVYVEFQNGDFLYPLWKYHGWGKNEMPKQLKGKGKFGFVTKFGHSVIIDDELGTMQVELANIQGETREVKTTILIDQSTAKLTSVNDVHIETEKKIILQQDKEGVPIASEILKKLNKLESEMESLRDALKIGAPPVVALAPNFAQVQTWSLKPPIIQTTLDDIQSKKVRQ